MSKFVALKNDETGAVTVDWVVLTAALVVAALATLAIIETGLETAASTIVSGAQVKG